MLCKELEGKEIKNHHVVHGVYSELLVVHSGRREADFAMVQAAKATKELEDIKTKFKNGRPNGHFEKEGDRNQRGC